MRVDVAKEYPDGVQPYWLACHVAMGRKPEPWEFMAWSTEHWDLFARSLGLRGGADGVRREFGNQKGREMYEAWLAAKYPNTGRLVE